MATLKKSASKKSDSKATRTTSDSLSQQGQETRLKEFFIDELKDIYWAEKKLVTTLPKMKKAASTQELQSAFADHLEVTKQHVARLEKVFELLGEKAVAKKCDAMAGIIEEGEGIIGDTESGTATRDVGLILAAQKVEHYEISTYGGLAQLAKTLGLTEVKDILGSTLSEEKEADLLLTNIAENNINFKAAEE